MWPTSEVSTLYCTMCLGCTRAWKRLKNCR